MRRIPSTLVTTLLLLPLLTACAHTGEFTGGDVVTVEIEETRTQPDLPPEAAPAPVRPDAAYDRQRLYGHPPAAWSAGEKIDVPVGRKGGMTYVELFKIVSDEAGILIRYQDSSATIKSRKVTFQGNVQVARNDLLAWLQDVAVLDSLVIIPFGPPTRGTYSALDLADPAVALGATFVAEGDLVTLVGRTGMFITSVLTVPEGIDPARARNALSQIATRTAGLGRVNDFGGGRHLMVMDFAANVVSMRRTLDAMAIEAYQAATR